MNRDSAADHLTHLCLIHSLKRYASQIPAAKAIEAPGRPAITYKHLYNHLVAIGQKLRQLGIHHKDRVAISLPSGPEMITAVLSVASCSTSVVLNPTLQARELESYLPLLNLKAVLVQANTNSIIRELAETYHIQVIEIRPTADAAGIFAIVNHGEGDERRAEKFSQTLYSPLCTPRLWGAERQNLPGYSTIGHSRQGNLGSQYNASNTVPIFFEGTLDVPQPEDVALVLLTSGTTDQPKLVPITQANLCQAALRVCKALHLKQSDRCLNIMPAFHSHGLIGAVISTLISGGTLICPPEFQVTQFLEWLDLFCPTWYTAVPTLHQSIAARAKISPAPLSHTSLRLIRSSSAPLPTRVATDLERIFQVPVIQTYGLTEAFQITCNPLPPLRSKPGSVGRSENPEDIAILDRQGKVLPPGEKGEIAIHRQSVICGYEANQTANQIAFFKHWFKTGDQGFMDADGFLFITGRFKEIINRGGEQISPYEIEDVLLEHPKVDQAVAFAVPDSRLGEDIAVAVVAQDGAVLTSREILQCIANQLTDCKIPSQVIFLADIPKGASGKPQRVGLAERLGVKQSHPQASVPFVAPRNPIERTLTTIWQEVLGRDQVGIEDHFYWSGGDSILATQCISRIREVIKVELSFISFFESPTIASLAQVITQKTKGQASREAIAPALIEAVQTKNGPYPLSIPQQQQWFLEQLKPSGPTYNLSAAYRIRGPLNLPALEHSLNQIVQRHKILRTTLVTVQGKPAQYIQPDQPISLKRVDLSEQVSATDVRQCQTWVNQEAQRSFNLEQGPLLRAVIWKLGEGEYLFLVCGPHIVIDGWSRGVLIRELSTLYTAYLQGETNPLAALPIQYTDFACWQQQRLREKQLENQLNYWVQTVSGAPTHLKLSSHQPRPPGPIFTGTRYRWAMPKDLLQRIQALSQQEGLSLYTTLLAVFNVMLYSQTEQDDIIVGSPFANRTRGETEELIGFFANTLPLRTRLGGNPSVRELLQRVRRVALEGFSAPELALEQLVKMLKLERNFSYAPIFQVVFVLLDPSWRQLELSGLITTPLEVNTTVVQCDLTLFLEPSEQGLLGTLEYNTDLFDEQTITRFSNHFEWLLLQVCEQPDLKLNALIQVLKRVDENRSKDAEQEYQAAKVNRLKNIRRRSLA